MNFIYSILHHLFTLPATIMEYIGSGFEWLAISILYALPTILVNVLAIALYFFFVCVWVWLCVQLIKKIFYFFASAQFQADIEDNKKGEKND